MAHIPHSAHVIYRRTAPACSGPILPMEAPRVIDGRRALVIAALALAPLTLAGIGLWTMLP